ncbi:hypothetical protein SNL152K_9275 [Streptomyces sp. NL15-2K]|nr:hypothetical protein SNL152K_9275 [Streptomyces sp. NL15-2K]
MRRHGHAPCGCDVVPMSAADPATAVRDGGPPSGLGRRPP